MTDVSKRRLAVIGGGPAGLMAAEAACAAGLAVDLYEAKGSVGRKFLIAGKGGLNLTHSDPMPLFAQRYRERAEPVAAWLRDFDADALRDWARGWGWTPMSAAPGVCFRWIARRRRCCVAGCVDSKNKASRFMCSIAGLG